jgi:hypothetical protein
MHGPFPQQVPIIPLDDDAERHDLHFDIEARSCLAIDDAGMHAYARHPTTEVLCVSWAVDHGPVRMWRRGDPVPLVWSEAARNPNWTAKAHNAPFEIVMSEHKLHPVHGFPIIPPERYRCTMAAALALGLSAKLKLVVKVLGLEHQKDVAGERLMRKMTKPRKPRKGEDPNGGPYWHEEPDQLDQLCNHYCPSDVLAERDLDDWLPPLSDAEQAVWQFSNMVNARGFFVDRPFALAAHTIAGSVAPEIDAAMAELTAGAVTGINQVERLKAWLQAQGCEMDSLAREKVEEQLKSEGLTAPARRALELRHEGAQSATAKVDALLDHACSDDRIRGAFKYHGASTGRWSGEGFQPQNLKRPETEPEGITAAIEAVATGDIAHVRKLYPKPLAIIGDLSRSMIMARSTLYRLFSGDFSAIESRVTAWVAGEEWKLDSYRRYDASQDPREEPYCITACKIFHVPDGSFNKKSPERTVGKTCLGPNTLVLTDHGIKPITSVQTGDRLWDGNAWVHHHGLMNQGLRLTIQISSDLWLTPDHRVLCGKSWRPAAELSNASTLSLALATGSANSPSPDMRSVNAERCAPSRCNAPAAPLNTAWPSTTYSAAHQPAALSVPISPAESIARTTGVTPTSAPTTHTDVGYSIESPRRSRDAVRSTIRILATGDMPDEEFRSSLSGGIPQRGGAPSSPICSRSLDGITRSSCSTGSITTEGMSQETSASPPTPPAALTSPRSIPATRQLPTYDLACAGPRRRFTVVTSAGLLIVHNCDLAFGFQGGLGAWRKLEPPEAHFTDDEVETFKNEWRKAHPKTRTFWDAIDRAAVQAVHKRGETVRCGRITLQCCEALLWLTLPSGRRLAYPFPRIMIDDRDSYRVVFGDNAKGQFKDCNYGKGAYGGIWTENCVSAISRDLLVAAMQRLEATGYPIVLHVHDECVAEVPIEFGSEQEFNRVMIEVPDWAQGLPIAAGVWSGPRYRK